VKSQHLEQAARLLWVVFACVLFIFCSLVMLQGCLEEGRCTEECHRNWGNVARRRVGGRGSGCTDLVCSRVGFYFDESLVREWKWCAVLQWGIAGERAHREWR